MRLPSMPGRLLRGAVAAAALVFVTAGAAQAATPSATADARAAAPSPAPSPATADLWRPPVQARWQYQLEGNRKFASTGGIDVNVCVTPQKGGACVRPDVFDIDLYVDAEVAGNNHTVNTAAVKAIHARGAKAICYVNAGSIEEFRPDYKQFVDWHNAHGKSLLGKPFSPEFPNERWANINNDKGQRDFILKMMEPRVAKCAQAGFDGIEFDVVHAHEVGKKTTGWNISAATQLTFNKALAAMAHRHGLSVALKNDLSQVRELVSHFDYAVNEECFAWDECDELKPFIAAGKPVFHVEYETAPKSFCGDAVSRRFSSIKKAETYALKDRPYTPCR
ncbi:endo alpha-1,4 polygalactosaminidase [Bailinhaonella thermotolerans]|uniref:endo alpha-1,4 polygalactosaminidase n=1 Tax=Bailinhaonella thermotolerans TaxID=1070861 RepID=UPI00192A5F48|nr:endo alpha-1,4 polygalactosaminidase [Bailinhaonella thermotolerans]